MITHQGISYQRGTVMERVSSGYLHTIISQLCLYFHDLITHSLTRLNWPSPVGTKGLMSSEITTTYHSKPRYTWVFSRRCVFQTTCSSHPDTAAIKYQSSGCQEWATLSYHQLMEQVKVIH